MFGLHPTPAVAKVGEQGNPGSFAELIKKAGPSVVNIIAVKVMHTPDQGSSHIRIGVGPKAPIKTGKG